MVADNSGSGATTSTRIEDSGRNPQIIPGQKSASRRSRLISPKPVSGPRGSAEGLKDYFRIADHPRTDPSLCSQGQYRCLAGGLGQSRVIA